jgi:myo-inositol-1(or 4)-monophosphatase
MPRCRGIRRLGSAALDLAYTACGRFDAFFEYSLAPWDVAAGAFIVEEAGGIVCDFSGGDNYLFGKEMFASNPFIEKELLEILKSQFMV